MTTMTRTAIHVIGRCPTKGCRRAHRETLDGTREWDRGHERVGWSIPTESGPQPPEPNVGRPGMTVDAYLTAGAAYYGDGWRGVFVRHYCEAMISLGFVCPDHDRFMRLVAVRGTYNEAIACNAACEGATGPVCECWCAGENHGIGWAS